MSAKISFGNKLKSKTQNIPKNSFSRHHQQFSNRFLVLAEYHTLGCYVQTAQTDKVHKLVVKATGQ
jgi:hypothetical protein